MVKQTKHKRSASFSAGAASILLAALLLFSGCDFVRWNGGGQAPSGKPDPSEAGSDATQPSGQDGQTAYPYLEALPAADLEGVTLAITTPFKADFDDDGGDLYSAALTARTSAVQDKYNVGIAVVEKDVQGIYDDLTKSIQSGEYYSDLIAIPMSWYGKFVLDGLIKPLSSVEEIDLSQPYYSPTTALRLRGEQYGVIGAASQRVKYAYAVYFNAALAEQAGLDLYTEVNAGSWTWDYFLSLLVGRHGSGIACSSQADLVNAVFTSSGLEYTALDGDARFCAYAGKATDHVIEIAETLLYGGALADTDNPAGAFAGGQCLFYIGTVGEARSFNDMPDSYGLLPLPAYAPKDDYRSYVSTDMPVLCIPAGSAASEHAGMILQAYSAASYQVIDDAYLELQMAYSLRDNDSARMMKQIRAGMKYDFAYLFGRHYPAVENAAYGAVYSAVTSGADHAALYAAAKDKLSEFVN